MKKVNLNVWQVYYMDNDGHKKIIESGLSYFKAVNLVSYYYGMNISAEYEAIHTNQ